MNSHCPFCSIVEENIERILRQTNHVFVVLSNPRLMEGHMLVIPKRHVEKISELIPLEQKEIFDELVNVEEKLLKNGASGCDINQHFRPFLEQSRLKINHLHFHVCPRELNDELYQVVQKHERDVFRDVSQEEISKYKTIIM